MGLVLRIDAKTCHVEVAGETHILPLRGKLFEQPSQEKRPITVGDRVTVSLGEDGGAIESVLPRQSKLSRSSAGEGDREQVLAANLSLVMVTAAITQPAFQPELVDRILAGAERERLDAVVVLTKVDRDRRDAATAWAKLYRDIGYRAFVTSVVAGAETTAALEELGLLLHQNVTDFVGLSGVGKSSLINRLIPGLDLRVGGLGKQAHGRHTTTHTRLVPLPGGGYVLDTPGIRNFGLFGLQRHEVAPLFREFQPFLGRCGYRDCTHLVEPDCAVRAARNAGTIAPSRWESYEALMASCD